MEEINQVPTEEPQVTPRKKKPKVIFNDSYSFPAYKLKPKPPIVVPIPVGVAPITEDFWNSLGGKERWDSIAALRGPDLRNSDTLKWFTTSVIRRRMSGVMRVGGLVNQELPFVVLPKESLRDSDFSATHFVGHVYEAARWLQIPMVMAGRGIWDAMLSGRSRHKVLAMLWKESEDPVVKEATEKVLAFHWSITPDSVLGKESPDAEGGSLEG
jgi:hypothetical protein